MAKKIIILNLVLILLFSVVALWYTFHGSSSKSFTPYDNEVVATFLEQRGEKNDPYFHSLGKLFCSATSVWEQTISSDEKIVYNKAQCQFIVLKDGDLRGEGGGTEPPLYRLKKNNGLWIVSDNDDRGVSSSWPSKKEWVNTYNRMVPNSLKFGQRANYLVTERLIQKAARYYDIGIPNYSYASCSAKTSCQENEICVKERSDINGSNVCMMRCQANNECGVGHTCRKQCVNGENGCPASAQAICIPDLLHVSLEKNPRGIIN